MLSRQCRRSFSLSNPVQFAWHLLQKYRVNLWVTATSHRPREEKKIQKGKFFYDLLCLNVNYYLSSINQSINHEACKARILFGTVLCAGRWVTDTIQTHKWRDDEKWRKFYRHVPSTKVNHWKSWVFSFKVSKVELWRSWSGRGFQTEGPARENARWPADTSLVRRICRVSGSAAERRERDWV